MIIARKTAKPEKLMLRVVKGGFVPADVYTSKRLSERKYGMGEIVAGQISKPRNPKFFRLAHQLGALVVENIESFKNADAHIALKRMQIEAGIGCYEIGIMIPGLGAVIQRIPKSLSFESMSEAEFHDVVRGFCRHIAETYWPDMSPEKIEQMAECFVCE